MTDLRDFCSGSYGANWQNAPIYSTLRTPPFDPPRRPLFGTLVPTCGESSGAEKMGGDLNLSRKNIKICIYSLYYHICFFHVLVSIHNFYFIKIASALQLKRSRNSWVWQKGINLDRGRGGSESDRNARLLLGLIWR